MPSLKRNEKVQCGDCGNMYVRQHAARHRKRCAKGVISCPDCKYFTYNQQEMNYHMAKKHAPSSLKQSTVRPVKNSLRVTSLSNIIGEKYMG